MKTSIAIYTLAAALSNASADSPNPNTSQLSDKTVHRNLGFGSFPYNNGGIYGSNIGYNPMYSSTIGYNPMYSSTMGYNSMYGVSGMNFATSQYGSYPGYSNYLSSPYQTTGYPVGMMGQYPYFESQTTTTGPPTGTLAGGNPTVTSTGAPTGAPTGTPTGN